MKLVKKQLRLKKKYAIIGIVLCSILTFFLVLAGASYGFFSTRVTTKEYVVYTGSLQVDFDNNGNGINLQGTKPMTNQEGLATTGYTFNVKNKGTINARYQVRLELADDNEIPIEYIKMSYTKTKDDSETISSPTASEPVLLSNLNSSLTFISNEKVEANKTDTINLKVWLDISTPNDMQGKTFKAKIVVDAIQDVDDGYVFISSPIINLKKDSDGNINSNLELNDTYTDPGVESVTDDKHILTASNVTSTIEYYDGTNLTTVNSIDTTTTGIYYITYSITDSDNKTGKAIRVITVNNTKAIPTIALNGNATINLTEGDTYTDPGVTVTNNNKVVTLGEVKTSAPGTYIVRYIVIDNNGNMNSITRTVNVNEIISGKLNEIILANNTLRTETPDFTTSYPNIILSYTDNNFNGTTSNGSMSSTYQSRYFTYADSYTFDTTTGTYTLVNPQVCQYSSCYETLKNKYIVSTTGSTSTTAATSNNRSTIYKVTSDTTLDKLYYIYSTKTPNYDSSLSGLYKMSITNGFGGQDGDTYYFRGDVNTNKVKFANLDWRVIRINEDGTVRLILDGSTDESDHVFNSNYNDFSYMYYSNSSAKTNVESWYNINITGTNASKVATGNYFCEAAKVKYSSSYTSGSATMQLYNEYTPDLVCNTDGNNKGLLNNSVGLINYDEVVLAGGYYGKSNSSYYLYQNYDWWTMSPAGFYYAYAWYVYSDRSLYYFNVDSSIGRLRPVINLKADTLATYNAETGYYEVN